MFNKIICLTLLILLLAGCSDPLPQNRLNYAGEWQSKEMYLLIQNDGTVSYQRLKNGGSVSINGPLQEFKGDNFEVGFGPFSTTFEVSEPPHLVEDHWEMVVDGVRLTKTSN
ncbi:hypothetical protein [Hahella ganghwensis]|uniref:hypothetical protein n=1 Tax=Hahella ganghwensis TaxID=286420 RepID=UPI000367B2B6|nr:hypothetical protein [Hahella ganghwensis]